jgi:hypothetical protein
LFLSAALCDVNSVVAEFMVRVAATLLAVAWSVSPMYTGAFSPFNGVAEFVVQCFDARHGGNGKRWWTPERHGIGHAHGRASTPATV